MAEHIIIYLIISVVVGILVSRHMLKKRKKQHMSVQLQTEATRYVQGNSLKITNGKERFLYHHITRVPVNNGRERGPGGPGGFGGGPGGFGGGRGGR